MVGALGTVAVNVNVAEIFVIAANVNVQVVDALPPLQVTPVHPAKVLPAAVVATSVTVAPAFQVALQVAPQAMDGDAGKVDATELPLAPLPVFITVTV